MIVPYDDDNGAVSEHSSHKEIMAYRKKHKHHRLSYFELVELQLLQYRNARVPRRIREVRPITPPEVIEIESSAKPAHKWIPKKQKVNFFFLEVTVYVMNISLYVY
jgi:hypothetical protein